ncbi:MAG: sulfatase-like hydrolase/transferase, partial [Planctomycetales bacterium]
VEVLKERPRDQPFFLWFAAIDAHRGWDADDEWDEQNYGPKHTAEGVVVPPYLVDNLPTREDLASYYNEVTRFDWYVGQVIAELKKQNELDNTLVMVMADNGSPFPRFKTRVHDSGMKTAFVTHWPQGIQQSDSTCNSLLSAIDICPTVLQLAGLEVPPQVQGVSFAKLFKDPAEQVRRYAFCEHNWHDYEAHGRAVRDRDGYLYIRNARPRQAWSGPADSIGSPSQQEIFRAESVGKLTKAQADVLLAPRPEEELYCTPDDPLQLDNLAKVKDHGAKLLELIQVMDLWQELTGDTVPRNLTPDHYDRHLGYIDVQTGKRITGGPVWGEAPGVDRGADRINQPGPR